MSAMSAASTPKERLFTVDEYHRMGEAGIFAENDHVELLEGRIVQMTPIGSRHAACVSQISRLLTRALPEDVSVRVQNPIQLSDLSEPEPDIAVSVGPESRYAKRHPAAGDVSLLIEVCDTSAAFDRGVKLPLYAQAGIREVWLVDLVANAVEVFRDPRAGAYQSITKPGRDETIAPSAHPSLALRAVDLLL